jgi:hypothetical protein
MSKATQQSQSSSEIRAIYEDACRAAVVMSPHAKRMLYLPIGIRYTEAELLELSELTGAEVRACRYRRSTGDEVCETVSWTVCGIRLEASGWRPARDGDEAIDIYRPDWAEVWP